MKLVENKLQHIQQNDRDLCAHHILCIRMAVIELCKGAMYGMIVLKVHFFYLSWVDPILFMPPDKHFSYGTVWQSEYSVRLGSHFSSGILLLMFSLNWG